MRFRLVGRATCSTAPLLGILLSCRRTIYQQLLALLLRVPLANKYSLDYYQIVLADGFTSSSQTQEIQFAALIVARMVEGVDTVPALRELIELVTSAPGYTEYCQHQRQIENGTYWTDKTLRQQLTFEPADYENQAGRFTTTERR